MWSSVAVESVPLRAGIVTTSMFTATTAFEDAAKAEKLEAGKDAAAKQLAKLMEAQEMKNTIRGARTLPRVWECS